MPFRGKVRENAAALDAIFNQFTNKIASLKFYEGNKIKSFVLNLIRYLFIQNYYHCNCYYLMIFFYFRQVFLRWRVFYESTNDW